MRDHLKAAKQRSEKQEAIFHLENIQFSVRELRERTERDFRELTAIYDMLDKQIKILKNPEKF